MKKLSKSFLTLKKEFPTPVPDVTDVIKEIFKTFREKEKTERIKLKIERDIKEIEFKEKVANMFFEKIVNKRLEDKSKSVDVILKAIEKLSKKGNIPTELLKTLIYLIKTSTITDEEMEFLNNIFDKKNKIIPIEFEEEEEEF